MFRSSVFAAAAAFALSTAEAPAATIADVYSSFWVFGDSLSDNGNVADVLAASPPSIVFPPPPYFDGRFSNGPVWNERFLDDFGADSSRNFAFGGARTAVDGDFVPDLPVQVATFAAALPTFDLGSRSLASVFAGSNDLFDAVTAAAASAPGAIAGVLESRALSATSAIAASVGALSALGIDEFALWTLPDIGSTPRLRELGAAAQGLGTLATLAFNGAFDQMVTDLRASGLTIHTVDVFALFAAAASDPSSFGLTNLTEPCLPVDPFLVFGAPSAGEACAAPDGFLYWDKLHPTSRGHDALATAFDASVPAVPLPAPALLLIGGLAGLGALRRRAS